MEEKKGGFVEQTDGGRGKVVFPFRPVSENSHSTDHVNIAVGVLPCLPTGNRNVLSAGRGGHARQREADGERPDGLPGRVELDEGRVPGTGSGRQRAAGPVQERADRGEEVQAAVRPPQAGLPAEGGPAGRRPVQHVLARAHLLPAEHAAVRRDRGRVVRERHQRLQT